MQIPFVPSYSHEIFTFNSSHILVVHNWCFVFQYYNVDSMCSEYITIFRSKTMFSKTDNILHNVPHIQPKCEEYFAKHCLGSE